LPRRIIPAPTDLPRADDPFPGKAQSLEAIHVILDRA
jgi:hypothetical protein